VIRIPALIVLGFWIALQIVSGLGLWGFGEPGVAWFAHIGGFAAGLILVFLFQKNK
jgi:membrane associated rhomboid family serine protease